MDSDNIEPGPKGQRYFKCIYNNQEAGRYVGSKPKQAASKALTALIRNNDGLVGKDVNFSLKEVTRNSPKKIFEYKGKREKLDKPLTITIGKDNAITYNYSNKVTRVHSPKINDDKPKDTGTLHKEPVKTNDEKLTNKQKKYKIVI